MGAALQKHTIRETEGGSRMHVLDWVEGLAGPFRDGLNTLVAPTGAKILPSSKWMPYSSTEIGRRDARLMMDDGLLDETRQGALKAWWVAGGDPRGSEPRWDLAATAVWPDGREGLVLVAAHAHANELSAAGREAPPRDAPRRRENHESIGDAIAETRAALASAADGFDISRDHHYDLSSRVALAWKLARLGTPVALVYLGFVGDRGLAGHLTSETQWRRVFEAHCRDVFPAMALDREIAAGAASFWLLVRARMCVRLSHDSA